MRAIPGSIPGEAYHFFRRDILQTDKTIENNFKYHTPKAGQPETYETLRSEAKNLAYLIMEKCPNSRERSLAITKLEEAMMWANAAVARN